MLKATRKITLVTLCAVFLVHSGCGPASIEYAPVKGRITMDDQPVANAKILFIPTQQRNENRIALPYSYAYTDDHGKYSLKTEKDQNGAVVGTHVVIISTAFAPDPESSGDEDDEKKFENKIDGAKDVERADSVNKDADEKKLADQDRKMRESRPETIPPQYNIRSELNFDVKRGTGNQADFRLTSKPH